MVIDQKASEPESTYVRKYKVQNSIGLNKKHVYVSLLSWKTEQMVKIFWKCTFSFYFIFRKAKYICFFHCDQLWIQYSAEGFYFLEKKTYPSQWLILK